MTGVVVDHHVDYTVVLRQRRNGLFVFVLVCPERDAAVAPSYSYRDELTPFIFTCETRTFSHFYAFMIFNMREYLTCHLAQMHVMCAMPPKLRLRAQTQRPPCIRRFAA